MKRLILISASVGLIALLLTGCHSQANDIANKSRTDQEQAFRGDAAKRNEMAAKMMRQYVHPPQPPSH